ncbi:hypothetical protein COMA2_30250 [Candidatus Nitrospira nitrificans]|uniref:Uncharacterized protein n=1 Tax=Candidatus Nitrospira nitrificans TaxID=1742973 RepID=A0A0S4LLC9_9BACT|nr:hypothetical protein COMA2_30250 [Candidatus Nitrospira nitrificans]
MVPSPFPLSKRNEGQRAEAIFAYSSSGLAEGAGRVRMSGVGALCKNGIDEGSALSMVGMFLDTNVGSLYRSDFCPHRPLTA